MWVVMSKTCRWNETGNSIRCWAWTDNTICHFLSSFVRLWLINMNFYTGKCLFKYQPLVCLSFLRGLDIFLIFIVFGINLKASSGKSNLVGGILSSASSAAYSHLKACQAFKKKKPTNLYGHISCRVLILQVYYGKCVTASIFDTILTHEPVTKMFWFWF